MADSLKLLLCDDDPGLRDLFIDFFEGEGIDVTVAEDGEKGLLAMKGTKFDGIVTDIEMPVLCGLEFIKKIKEDKQNSRTPIFILSGMIDENVRRIAYFNIVEVFEKPFDPERILERIRAKVFSQGQVPRYHSSLLDCFYDASSEILEHYLDMKDIQFGTIEIRKKATTSSFMTGMILLNGGHFKGANSITASEGFVRVLADAMTQNGDHSTEMLRSALSEMVNQLAGRIKLKFEKRGVHCQISIPETFLGEGNLFDLTSNYSICLPLLVCEQEVEFWLNLSDIDKSKINEHVGGVEETQLVMLW